MRPMRELPTVDAAQLPALLTAAEVADALRVSAATVHRAVERGELRAVRLGGKGGTVRIPGAELERVLAGRDSSEAA